jgi:hypothetical protein
MKFLVDRVNNLLSLPTKAQIKAKELPTNLLIETLMGLSFGDFFVPYNLNMAENSSINNETDQYGSMIKVVFSESGFNRYLK